MEQDQADAKGQWHEASQHPGSEMKRVVVRGVEANEVESDREHDAQGRDDDPPAQQAFAWFFLRAGEAFFGEGDGLLVIQVAQKSEKAEDDGKRRYKTEAGEKFIHEWMIAQM